MTSRRSCLILLMALPLASCTAIYQRHFQVVSSRELTNSERGELVLRYRDFMVGHGYAVQQRSDAAGQYLAFTIRDARSRLLPTSGVTDQISVRAQPSGVFVGLHRVSSYPPDDFSSEYLFTFIRLTAKYFSESSGIDVTLQEVIER
ncbi:hypothetical protein [Roseateles sp. BYS96W]|uniref:Lipoprotein n=1 Tax=Pelomonas nitida TaxID=3299027 RepID=A0ABW7G6K1_9BURK